MQQIPFKALLYPALCLLLLAGCSKGSSVTNVPNPTPPPAPNPPAPYIVRTIGVSGAVITLDSSYKIFRYRSGNGIGNSVQFWPGSDLQLELGAANTEPVIRVPEPSVHNAVYPNPKVGSTLAVTDADSAYLHLKVKGFNRAQTGFHQLNVIFCDDGTLSAGVMSFSATSPVTPAMLTNAFIKAVFNTKVNKLQIGINGQLY